MCKNSYCVKYTNNYWYILFNINYYIIIVAPKHDKFVKAPDHFTSPYANYKQEETYYAHYMLL